MPARPLCLLSCAKVTMYRMSCVRKRKSANERIHIILHEEKSNCRRMHGDAVRNGTIWGVPLRHGSGYLYKTRYLRTETPHRDQLSAQPGPVRMVRR